MPLTFGCGEKEPDGKVHITYWEKWTGVEGEAMQSVVDAFNRSQNRVEVEYLAVSAADRKTLLATAGGDPPDVAGLYAYNVYQFADSAALTPLDPFIEKSGATVEAWAARYYPAFFGLGQYAGKIWALPSTPAVVILHWNKALFREAGLDPERPPTTLSELEEYNEKLTKKDPKTGEIVQMGFLPNEPHWFVWSYPLWFGGKLWDGRDVTLKSDESLAAYRWVASYPRKYGVNKLTSFVSGFGKFSSPQQSFFSGKVAMEMQGPWLNSFIRQLAPGLEYGVTGWPKTPSGPSGFAVVDADMLVIPRGAKHPDEAWEFIRYVSSINPSAQRKEELQGMELLCYGHEKTSPLREWSPYFEHHHPHPYIDTFRRFGAGANATSLPKMGNWLSYKAELDDVVNQVRLLQRSPEEAVEKGQARAAKNWTWHEKSVERHRGDRGATTPEPRSP